MNTLICHGCRTVGSVDRITAGLRCTCGSDDLDLFDPSELTFLEYMGAAHGPGTGWNVTRPDPLDGWSQYAGPMPGANPMPTPAGPDRCPECKGQKVDIRDGGLCRACKGTGKRTPTFSEAPEPLVKRHNYPSTQTSVPFMGRRRRASVPSGGKHPTVEEVIKATTPGWVEGQGQVSPGKFPNVSPHLKTRDDEAAGQLYTDDALRNRRQSQPYAMHEAECPNCGHAPTHLVSDNKGNGWWHCPNCGPLANIDKHPEIDPYNPPDDFKPTPRSFQARRNGSVRATGRILPMLATITATNTGLDLGEALGIARATVSRYAE